MAGMGILSIWAGNYLVRRGLAIFMAAGFGVVFYVIASNTDQVYILEKDTPCTKSQSFAEEMRRNAQNGRNDVCANMLSSTENVFTLNKKTAVILEQVERFDHYTIARVHFERKPEEPLWLFVRVEKIGD